MEVYEVKLKILCGTPAPFPSGGKGGGVGGEKGF